MSGRERVVDVRVGDGIGRVMLNRPHAMNAITVALATELESALRHLGSRDDVQVVLLRGAGGNFSAGGDVEEVLRLRADGPTALRSLFAGFAAACRAASEIPQPVVAAVEGVAMAGGFELLQAADVALVREDARLRDTHVLVGQVPGGGGSQRLPRLVGPRRALGHLLSGDTITAREAVAWGLAYRAVPPDDFDAAVEAFVATLAARSPAAVRSIKRLVHRGLAGSLDDGLDLELETVVAHVCGPDGAALATARSDR